MFMNVFTFSVYTTETRPRNRPALESKVNVIVHTVLSALSGYTQVYIYMGFDINTFHLTTCTYYTSVYTDNNVVINKVMIQ